MDGLVHAKDLAQQAGLNERHLRRLRDRGMVRPAVHLPIANGGSLALHDADDVLLARVVRFVLDAGGRLSDSAPVLLRLRGLEKDDRRAFLERAVLVRWPACKRLDVFEQAERVPPMDGMTMYRLRDVFSA